MATPANPNSSATSQARNTPLTPRPEPSCEPFELLRDQERRDGINPFTSHPQRRRNETLAPRGPLCPTAALSACPRGTRRPTPRTPSNHGHGHSTQPYTRHHTTTGRSTAPSHPRDPHSNGQSSPAAGRSAPGSAEPSTRALGCRRCSHHSTSPKLFPPQRDTHTSTRTRGSRPH